MKTEKEVEEICKRPKSERRYVLKYAGNRGPWAGGSGVFKLDGGGQGEVKLLLDAIRDSSLHHKPWILQERLRAKYDITHLTEEGTVETTPMHARIMPYYRTIQGKTEIIGGSAIFSGKWKVHGQPDSVHCAIEVVGG